VRGSAGQAGPQSGPCRPPTDRHLTCGNDEIIANRETIRESEFNQSIAVTSTTHTTAAHDSHTSISWVNHITLTRMYKSSVVAKMGDLLATIDMGRKLGRGA